MKWKWIFLLIIVCAGFAQIYSTVQFPPDIKWKEINTNRYRLVYPEELSLDAMVVASKIDHSFSSLGKTLPTRVEKFDLFLTNSCSSSNGSVGLAPRMSLWFSPPPQNRFSGTNEWYSLLTIHELRHVIQFDKVNQNAVKWMNYLGGEFSRLGASMAIYPMWFYEGDAVALETSLSSSGRGRIPSFDMEIRSLLLEDKLYSYHKAVNRSLIDYYPSHYNLGYLLVTYARKHNGGDVFSRVIDDTYFYPKSFSRMLKKHTGEDSEETYYACMAELDSLWRVQIKGLDLNNYEQMTPEYEHRSDSKPIGFGKNNEVIYDFSSVDELRTIRKLDDKSFGLYVLGYSSEVHACGNYIVWNDIISHHRWSRLEYSDIFMYDIASNRKQRITNKQRFYAPSISHNSKLIAAVEFNAKRECSIVLLNAENGNIEKRLKNPDNFFIRAPSWSENDEFLVYTRMKEHGNALVVYDIYNEKETILIDETHEMITNPVFGNDSLVLFEAPISGIDNIYAINIKNRAQYQLTSAKYGAFLPMELREDTLYYANYTANGFSIVKAGMNDLFWIPIEDIKRNSIEYYKELIYQEQGGDIFAEGYQLNEYEEKDYSKFDDLFNVHSWWLLPYPDCVFLGASSTNYLNTNDISVSTLYDWEDGTLMHNIFGSYNGIYPIIQYNLGYGTEMSSYDVREGSSTVEVEDKYTHRYLEAEINFPYDFSRGQYFRYFTLFTGLEYGYIEKQEIYEEWDQYNGEFTPIKLGLETKNIKGRSNLDIIPDLGYDFSLEYLFTPFESDYKGSQLNADIQLYLPSPFNKNHGEHIRLQSEFQDPENYRFPLELDFCRGYDEKYSDRIYSFAIDYYYPIAYPDFALGNFLYIKRIRGNSFVDYSFTENENDNEKITRDYSSIGLDFVMDYQFFNLPIMFNTGVRFSYRLNNNDIVTRIVLGGMEL